MVSLRTASKLAMISLLAAGIGGCSTFNLNGNNTPVAQEPAVEPEIPATIRADELVGRWGLAAYHKPEDRVRTENAARGQCKQPCPSIRTLEALIVRQVEIGALTGHVGIREVFIDHGNDARSLGQIRKALQQMKDQPVAMHA